MNVDEHVERQCQCNEPIEEKKLVKYNFHKLGIKIYVCENCLKQEPFNRYIIEIVGDENNASP